MGGIRIVDLIPYDSALEFDPNDVPALDEMPSSEVRDILMRSMPTPTVAEVEYASNKFKEIVKMGVIQDGQPIPSMFTWIELAALCYQGCIFFVRDDSGKDRLIASLDSDTPAGTDDSQTASDTWSPADTDYSQYLRYADDPISLDDYELYSESDNGDIKINRAEMFRYITDLRIVYDEHQHAYQWDLVRYHPVDDAYIRELMRAVVPIGSLTDRMISEIISELKDSAKFKHVRIPDNWNCDGRYDGTILPFRNGWLNVDTGAWLKPSPFYIKPVQGPKGMECMGMTYCFNVAYNPNVSPSAGSEWFRRLIPDDDTWRFVCEFFGSVMRMGGKSQPGFLIFQSEKGDTGKSAMYESLAKILGPDLVMRFDLDDLNSNFIGSLIENKWALICGEIGSHDIGNDKRLKRIAGREEIAVQRKYVDAYTTKPDVGMIFASNGIPNFGDRSDGMRRRVYPVPMNRKMNWDDQIWDAMHSDESLSWLVNEIIRAHKARNGGKFTVSAEMQALRNVIFASTDSLYAYLCDLCETDTLTPEIVQHILVDRPISYTPNTLDWLYSDYREYCTAHFIANPLGYRTVSSRLHEYDIQYESKTVRDEYGKTTKSYFCR